MNAALPVTPPELDAHPLAKAALRVEPRLSDLIALDELEIHLQRFTRQLRISSERDALARKDVVT